MKVSIVMPYFNAAKYIKETIDSIINQTFEDWELIVVDDCSTDLDSKLALDEIKTIDCRIKVFSTTTNNGAGAARNLGIEKSLGRYIAFCDSDDWWYPNKLQDQIMWMEANGYEFTCTWYEDSNEKLEPYYVMKQESKQNYASMISGCNIGTPGVIYDTFRIGKKYMPSLRRAEDWGLWMTILKEVDYIYTYPKVLWKYRHVQNSETSNKWKMMHAVITMYIEVLNFSVLKAYIVCLFIFLPKNMWKKLKKMV